MAKAMKHKKEASMEEALWKSADKLRGSVEPAEYALIGSHGSRRVQIYRQRTIILKTVTRYERFTTVRGI